MGNDTVVLFAVTEARGGGSSSEESKEIPLDGGWDVIFSAIASILDSSVEMDSSVCWNKRSIFLKCSL